MKKQSYKIKHDFLFDSDDDLIDIPKLDSNNPNVIDLKLSEVLKAKDYDSFLKLIDLNKSAVVIKDDIGPCINQSSERYKQFIIRCIFRKLSKLNIEVFY